MERSAGTPGGGSDGVSTAGEAPGGTLATEFGFAGPGRRCKFRISRTNPHFLGQVPAMKRVRKGIGHWYTGPTR
jgi:hypothetical protein